MLRGTGHRLSKVLNDVALDDRTALLDGLPASVTQQQQLNLLSCTIAPSVSLLGYPEGIVGRIRTIRLHSCRTEWTTAHPLDHVRRCEGDKAEGRVVGDARIVANRPAILDR